MMDHSGNLCSYLMRQKNWSKKTFGEGKRTVGICAHISKELHEICGDPHDLTEWIEVIILALDGYWRHGGDPDLIYCHLEAKQNINFGREWPSQTSEDSAAEHIR